MKTVNARVVSVRIPRETFVLIRGAALASGKALSAWMRDAALHQALEPSEQRQSEET